MEAIYESRPRMARGTQGKRAFPVMRGSFVPETRIDNISEHLCQFCDKIWDDFPTMME
jgi:hypothetical protein